ncbi:MAG: peptidoglycan DD-metalloendopeptidase family protein [Bacteroidales bacterium]|nr:peptidoglycan DD-metalloendopeptidase family protein [Bacteroidales bacterium]MCM1415100.1 peptidoglycan DD-metalloendopeptidase family protein [bacterium]MCM1423956.1 peptidoglycan DD-metalloendopeptidase family protein [bacterium]
MSTSLRKRKITYTIILTSDSPAAGHGRMHIKTGALAVVSFVLFVAVICYAVYVTITMGGYVERSAKQVEQIVELKAENETLAAENKTLGDRASSLEETLARKEEQEHELVAAHEENYIPKGFPMSGAAQILEEDTAAQTEGEEEEQAAEDDDTLKVEAKDEWKERIFVSTEGTKVVATAPGTVKEVRKAEGEVSYVVIDHGNGYVTTYRNLGSPIVEEGGQVVKGMALFLVGEDNTETGYSIRKDDEYVDPLELIEIKG